MDTSINWSGAGAYFNPQSIKSRLGTQVNWLVVITGFIVILLLSIVAGAVEHGKGDEKCECLSKPDRGWRAFSAVWFVFSLIYIVILILFGQRVDDSALGGLADML
jgi:Kef-type K+ transport system membrane component KefB